MIDSFPLEQLIEQIALEEIENMIQPKDEKDQVTQSNSENQDRNAKEIQDKLEITSGIEQLKLQNKNEGPSNFEIQLAIKNQEAATQISQIHKENDKIQGCKDTEKEQYQQVLSNNLSDSNHLVSEEGVSATITSDQKEGDRKQNENSTLKDDIQSFVQTIEQELKQEGFVELKQAAFSFEDILTSLEKSLIERSEVSSHQQQHDSNFLEEYLKLIQETGSYLDQLLKCSITERNNLTDIHSQIKQIEKQDDGIIATQQAEQITINEPEDLAEYLNVSITQVSYGSVFPGNIFENELEILNKLNVSVTIQILCQCLNAEFDAHGEYVYSIRKSNNYDYNEKLVFLLPAQASLKFHVALKVPIIQQKTVIKGKIIIQMNTIQSLIKVPIECCAEIPKVVCTRHLFNSTYSSKIIRVAIRRQKKSECKIPFKNCHNNSVTLEPFWLEEKPIIANDIYNYKQSPFNLVIQPGMAFNVFQGGMFIINISVRPNIFFKDFTDQRNANQDQSPIELKNILVLRVFNSSVFIHFPISIEIY